MKKAGVAARFFKYSNVDGGGLSTPLSQAFWA